MKVTYKITYLILIIAFVGCSEDVLIKADIPPHLSSAGVVFSTQEGFESALVGLNEFVKYEFAGDMRYGAGIASPNFPPLDYWMAGTDDGFQANGNPVQEHFMLTNWDRVQSQIGAFGIMWDWLYQTINSANTIIDRATVADLVWTDEERDAVIGEARLFRAWAYRHLTYLFGDVPLVLSETTGVKDDFTRSPVAEIYNVMSADLKFAEQAMDNVPKIDGRPSAAVAKHYLAELLVLTGDYMNAIVKADEVINDPNYSLVTSRFMDIFDIPLRADGNSESLWTLTYDSTDPSGRHHATVRWFNTNLDNTGLNEARVENGGNGLIRIAMTSNALRNYDLDGNGLLDDDDRANPEAIRANWINADGTVAFVATSDWVTVDEETIQPAGDANRMNRWPVTRKYESYDPNNTSLNAAQARSFKDLVYLRLAETICLKAEAQARNGDVLGAATTLNALRNRANAPLLISADIDDVLDERSRELWGEDKRRYTLLRHNKWLERTRLFNVSASGTIQDFHKLYPIPHNVIDANFGAIIRQNPGY